MAQDLGLDHAAGPSGPSLLDAGDIVDGDVGDWSATVDWSAVSPIEFGWILILTTLTGCVDWAYLQVRWNSEDTNWGDYDAAENQYNIGSIQCAASDDIKHSGSHRIRMRYAQYRIANESGGSIDVTSSNTAIAFTDIFGDQA